MERINFVQVKGGQGTSVTACAVGLAGAVRGRRVLLGGEDGDALEAILGTPPGGGPAVPGLVLGGAGDPEGFDLVVYDGAGEGGTTLLVTRPCYLALRRAVRASVRAAGVVVVEEPGRALGVAEVAEVTGLPVVATIPVTAAVARAVDAGVLGLRLPRRLAAGADRILDFVAGLAVVGSPYDAPDAHPGA